MSDVSDSVYDQFSQYTSYPRDALFGYAKRQIRNLLDFSNDTTTGIPEEELEEDLTTEEVTTNINIPEMVKHFINETMTIKNASTFVQHLPEDELSSIIINDEFITYENNFMMFGNITGEINDTAFGNLTTNTTYPGNAVEERDLRDVILLLGVVFICLVMYIAYWINEVRQSKEEEEITISDVIRNYQSRYPTIEEEDEGTEMVEFNHDIIEDPHNDQPILHCPTPKPKRKKEYTAIPMAWDFDDQIVTKNSVGDKDVEVAKQDSVSHIVRVDIEATPEETETLMPKEKLMEECKDFKYMDE